MHLCLLGMRHYEDIKAEIKQRIKITINQDLSPKDGDTSSPAVKTYGMFCRRLKGIG